MANWNNPLLTSTYTNFLSEVKARDDDAVTLNHAGTATNLPTNAKKWVSASSKFQNWNGSSFDDLVLSVAGGGTGIATLASTRIPFGGAGGTFDSSANLNFDGTFLSVGSGPTSNYVGRFYASSNSTLSLGIQNADTTGTNARSKLEAKTGNSTGRILAIYNDNIYIGSETNTQVNFDVNSSTKMSIDTSGQIGIGIASSIAAKLHIYQNANSTLEARIDNPNTTDTNSRGKLSVIGGNATAAINAIHNDSVSFGSNTATKVNLYYNTSTVLSLESATSALVASSVCFQSGGICGSSPAFYGYRNSSSNQAAFFRQDGSGDIVRFDKSGTQVSFIDTNGNLGIGSGLGSASAKLHVQANSGSQLRLGYDGSNYSNFDVSSAGNLYLAPSGGYTVQKAPNAALADGSLSASNIVFYLNEGGNTLTVKAKYSDGTTVKTGTIALA